MKIAVVGAGPAGSFCAYHLAKAGADVSLIDPFPEAWEKPCGGGVPPKVRERFAEIDAYDGPRRPVAVGHFISPDGQAVRLVSGRPMWIVARRDFDGYLRRLALGAGAKFVRGRVQRVAREGAAFRLAVGDGLKCDYLIGADGAKSIVRRDLFGPIPRRLLTSTVGYFLRAEATDATSWFLPRPGYVWAYPRHDHLCLGGGSADTALDIWGQVDAIRRQHFAADPILKKWAAPIPFIRELAFYDGPATGDGAAVIGDAAGHVDALTGEGILYALWDGKLLAEALLAGRPGDYDERWRAEFGQELGKATKLSRWFYDPPTIRRVFGVATRSETMRRFLMAIMTDQPSYLQTGNLFLRKLPAIGWEMLRSLW